MGYRGDSREWKEERDRKSERRGKERKGKKERKGGIQSRGGRKKGEEIKVEKKMKRKEWWDTEEKR